MAECYRCKKPATIQLPKMGVWFCSYCAATTLSDLSVAVDTIRPPVTAKPAKAVKKSNPRRQRYWTIVTSAIVAMIMLFSVAAITVHQDGWHFFVQRSAGVGSTPDNGPSEQPPSSQTPTKVP